LDNARDRAELVKDVIALANTPRPTCYLLIGVDNDRNITGIGSLDEERIQQIVGTYITPPVRVQCDTVPIADASFRTVGVISIQATNRPHKVRRAIERLQQDDVFLKRGSITSKASPEEILLMYDENAYQSRELRQLERAAKTHIQLGHFDKAVEAYSRILELHPAAEMFFARAETYLGMLEAGVEHYKVIDLRGAVCSDLSAAIILSDSEEREFELRKRRFELFSEWSPSSYTSEQIEDDFNFVRNRLEGVERGKWIYQFLREGDYLSSPYEEGIALVKEALETGYNEPGLKEILVRIHCGCANYGLALKEVDAFLPDVVEDKPHYLELLGLKARILFFLDKVDEARKVVTEVSRINPNSVWYSFSPLRGLEEFTLVDTLRKYLVQHEFTGEIRYPMDYIITLLCFVYGREPSSVQRDKNGNLISFITRLARLEEQYPGLHQAIRDYLPEHLWKRLMDIQSDVTIAYGFPGFPLRLDDQGHVQS
jgi:tetratricopeptide (TPR) repeat protein